LLQTACHRSLQKAHFHLFCLGLYQLNIKLFHSPKFQPLKCLLSWRNSPRSKETTSEAAILKLYLAARPCLCQPRSQGPLSSSLVAADCVLALHFRPAWQTCLTPFDQLYVLLFLPMKMRCDRVLWDYFTRGRDGVCQVKARNLSMVTFIVRAFYRIFLQVPKHIYSCLWSLILSVRSFVKCSVVYCIMLFVVMEWVISNGSSLRSHFDMFISSLSIVDRVAFKRHELSWYWFV